MPAQRGHAAGGGGQREQPQRSVEAAVHLLGLDPRDAALARELRRDPLGRVVLALRAGRAVEPREVLDGGAQRREIDIHEENPRHCPLRAARCPPTQT